MTNRDNGQIPFPPVRKYQMHTKNKTNVCLPKPDKDVSLFSVAQKGDLLNSEEP